MVIREVLSLLNTSLGCDEHILALLYFEDPFLVHQTFEIKDFKNDQLKLSQILYRYAGHQRVRL